MSKKKPKISDPYLAALEVSFNRAKSIMQYSKSARFYGKMAEMFGIKISDSELQQKPVWFNDLEIFKIQLIFIYEDNKRSRRYLAREIQSVDCEQNRYNERTKTDAVALYNDVRGESSENTRTPYDTEENESNSKSSFIPKYPDQEAELLTQKQGCDQVTITRRLYDFFTNGGIGCQIIAATGSGKTYVASSLCKNFIEQGWLNNCPSPWPTLWVTKASAIQQTQKVLRDEFNISVTRHVHVVNVEHLRSELGKLFVHATIRVINGVEKETFVWNKNIHPWIFFLDESHILVRDSIQGNIAQAINEIAKLYGVKVLQIRISATPFSRVCEAKTFACSTGRTFKLGLQEMLIDDSSWPIFAKQIAYPAEPTDYCEAAVERLREFFEPNIFRIKNIRPKFKVKNGILWIDFKTQTEREEYEKAWEIKCKMDKIINADDEMSDAQKYFCKLAVDMAYRKAAENCKRQHLARFLYESSVNKRAPALGLGFKQTISSVYRIMVEDYGWTRDDISIIWGGATETLSKKTKLALQIKNNPELQKIFKDINLDLDDIGIDIKNVNEKTQEQYEFEKLHGLLTQKPEDREGTNEVPKAEE